MKAGRKSFRHDTGDGDSLGEGRGSFNPQRSDRPGIAMRNGDIVAAITFSQALPDFARYLIHLTGVIGANCLTLASDSDRNLTALFGDVTGDRRVNSTDVGGVTGLGGIDPINPAEMLQVRSDVTNDGRINSTDVGGVTSLRGRDTRFIADPIPPAGAGGGTAGLFVATGSAPATPSTGTAVVAPMDGLLNVHGVVLCQSTTGRRRTRAKGVAGLD